jgi:hypothetical protein
LQLLEPSYWRCRILLNRLQYATTFYIQNGHRHCLGNKMARFQISISGAFSFGDKKRVENYNWGVPSLWIEPIRALFTHLDKIVSWYWERPWKHHLGVKTQWMMHYQISQSAMVLECKVVMVKDLGIRVTNTFFGSHLHDAEMHSR